ncbi:hypothetical protein SOVF_009330 [Spinacia oleracea]|uniref:C2 domain-containing protein n=1 Tax=Spinacia oleracea TaxID=3562 RepID=A0A9R0JQX9_SPIOL|nr:uncharacterized protein LOC110783312 [Spinacia oleracea]KNA25124.1 hypothetical protein SOVF_009330 [Spinacia oleracea]
MDQFESSSGKLEIFIHHARNIHNICIYDNQDVYSKFSLTYNPDEMVSTRVVLGGGKNPEFEEKLELSVKQIDSVLKCEIWMLSRVRNLLEDQLLGFSLVPIPLIINQGGKISCQNFSLSSTDLFHSPAGTVQLSLSLSENFSSVFSSANNLNSSISSEVVLLDPNDDYSSVQFPDISAVKEDQVMVAEYFNSNTRSFGSFLHLGSDLKAGFDYEMAGNSSEENDHEHEQEHENRDSGILSSTTSISDDQPETGEKQSEVDGETRNGGKINEIDDCTGESSGYGNPGRVFSGQGEVEQSAMQQQIVDMYMKSMQQFTESLANMKLPMDLDPGPGTGTGTGNEGPGNVIRVMERGNDLDVENKKKDGSRVFYGSRAFF